MNNLTFQELREANERRKREIHPSSLTWSVGDWGCALAGEVGELCNLIKKVRRGENISIEDIAHEIADVQIYLNLVAHEFDLDLAECTRNKFNITSDKLCAQTHL